MRRSVVRLLSTRRHWSSIEVKDEVKQGLKRNAVVALESTIITHGLPWPENLKTAQSVEEIIRAKGIVPATIAILDGKLKVGLTNEELVRVAQAKKAKKTSTQNLAAVIVESRLDSEIIGGTTVAGTLLACRIVGIDIFATGGIGGVHAGGEHTMDISADLIELGRSSGIAVVCAGCKSILDIERTLQVLETQGVAVMGYQTNELPTFYSTSKQLKPPIFAKDANFVAQWLDTSQQLNLPGGALIAVPHNDDSIEIAVQQAKEEAKAITGPEATPFMLQRIAQITNNKSIQANVALIQRNATVAADIALAKQPVQIVVFGVAALDHHHYHDNKVVVTSGGVARNIAEAAGRAGANVTLVSAIRKGDISHFDCSFCQYVQDETDMPNYQAHYDAFGSVTKESFFDGTQTYNDSLLKAVRTCIHKDRSKKLIILDADLPEPAFDAIEKYLLELPHTTLWLEPTTPTKASRLCRFLPYASLATPNSVELEAMAQTLGIQSDCIEQLAYTIATKTRTTLVVTRGHEGILVATPGNQIKTLHTTPIPLSFPNTTLGAGDTFVGVTAAAWIRLFRMDSSRLVDALSLGMKAAALTVQSPVSVHPSITPEWLDNTY